MDIFHISKYVNELRDVRVKKRSRQQEIKEIQIQLREHERANTTMPDIIGIVHDSAYCLQIFINEIINLPTDRESSPHRLYPPNTLTFT